MVTVGLVGATCFSLGTGTAMADNVVPQDKNTVSAASSVVPQNKTTASVASRLTYHYTPRMCRNRQRTGVVVSNIRWIVSGGRHVAISQAVVWGDPTRAKFGLNNGRTVRFYFTTKGWTWCDVTI